jgi:predicted nucleic acid-binding protein
MVMTMNARGAMAGSQNHSFSILLDTNVIVYFYDPREPAKQAHARQILPVLQANQLACLPVQALAEFTNLAPHKLQMTKTDTYTQVTALAAVWRVVA